VFGRRNSTAKTSNQVGDASGVGHLSRIRKLPHQWSGCAGYAPPDGRRGPRPRFRRPAVNQYPFGNQVRSGSIQGTVVAVLSETAGVLAGDLRRCA